MKHRVGCLIKLKILTWKINFKGIINYSAFAMYCMLELNKRANKWMGPNYHFPFNWGKKKNILTALKTQPHSQLDTLLNTNGICYVFECLQTLRINFNTSILVGWPGHRRDCPWPVEGDWLYTVGPQGSHPRPDNMYPFQIVLILSLEPTTDLYPEVQFLPFACESLGRLPLFLTLALPLYGVLSFLSPLPGNQSQTHCPSGLPVPCACH